MTIPAVVFASLSLLVLASALAVVLLRNVLHSALALGLALAGVAGLFACLGADFLFAAQVLIYVSGIAVLILFVVLLSGRASDLALRQVNRQGLSAAAICGILLWGLVALYRPLLNFFQAPAQPTTAGLASLLLGDLALPFEVISLLLLASLVGAILFSRREEP